MPMPTESYGDSLGLVPESFPDPARDLPASEDGGPQEAVLAGGCFWCVEAVYRALEGVLEVTSGYAGDDAASADYRSVCSGRTNHAEVVRVRFDPSRISYGTLLKVFFSVAHDPTQLDRQGADVGRQYRSAIFPLDEAQKEIAEAYIAQLDAAGAFASPIATTIEPLETFFEAEAYHQDYAAQNPTQPYIAYNTAPKLAKLSKHFAERLKKG